MCCPSFYPSRVSAPLSHRMGQITTFLHCEEAAGDDPPGTVSQHIFLLCMSNQQPFRRRLCTTAGHNDSSLCHGRGSNSPVTKGRAMG